VQKISSEVVFEQAGVVPDLGDEGLADAAPADRDLQLSQ
jgi:hypothetical protein